MSNTAGVSQTYLRWLLARPSHRLVHIWPQGMPTHLQYIRQIPPHLQPCFQDHRTCTVKTSENIFPIWTPKWFLQWPPFSSVHFITTQDIDHITSFPLYFNSNPFIKKKVKTIKATTHTTAKASGTSVEILLLNIYLNLNGPYIPLPWDNLHNSTQECPG